MNGHEGDLQEVSFRIIRHAGDISKHWANFFVNVCKRRDKMLQLILITVILVGLAIGGIAIKMFLKKDGEFKKTCGSVDPDTGQALDCTCGKPAEEMCDNQKKSIPRIDVKKITVG